MTPDPSWIDDVADAVNDCIIDLEAVMRDAEDVRSRLVDIKAKLAEGQGDGGSQDDGS